MKKLQKHLSQNDIPREVEDRKKNSGVLKEKVTNDEGKKYKRNMDVMSVYSLRRTERRIIEQ